MSSNHILKMSDIEVRGARVHNLRGVDVTIPRHKLVVITGLSGSGKSSLAFDTIYAEGQRRYMETLSAYARQFIGSLERPDVDSIDGLSPIIAIEQKTTGRNPRSTVGTITEIYDFLRLLYARASNAYSPATGLEMIRYTDEQIVNLIMGDYSGKKAILLSPLVKGRKGHYRELFDLYIKRGFVQMRVDGEIKELVTLQPLDRYKAHYIELVVDKIIPAPGSEKRVRESVISALHHGKGALSVLDTESGAVRHLSKHLMCPESGISYPEPAPHTFSFNSPQGACPHCKGLGMISKADISKIIPDDSRSIAAGAITPIGSFKNNMVFAQIEAVSKKYGFSLHEPVKDIQEDALNIIIYGSDELFRVGSTPALSQMMSFPGIISMIEKEERDSEELIVKKERFTEEILCPLCNGTRLKEESLHFKIDGLNISEVSEMDLQQLHNWLCTIEERLSARQKAIARYILKELR